MRRSRVVGAVLAGALALAGLTGPTNRAAGADAGARSAASERGHPGIVAVHVLGHSVRGRPITAWHLGEQGRPGAATVVLIAAMHGNEQAPRQILEALRDGAPVLGIDLWVVPTYNPDGVAAHRRQNAHGVDLNRNYPLGWVDLDGNYESGPRPASEPETRAMMGFLRTVRPDYILSFHQPLNGVDVNTQDPAFARSVARHLHLPQQSLNCGGACHGTMTSWFNARFPGTALTVEYGAHPSRRRMRQQAPRQVLAIFDAWRGYVGAEPVGPEPTSSPTTPPTPTPTTSPTPTPSTTAGAVSGPGRSASP